MSQEVGYGRPPSHSRFKKGASGNPKGRPIGSINLKIDLALELGAEMWVEGEGPVTAQRRMIRNLIAKAVEGDVRAIGVTLALSEKYLLEEGIGDDESPREQELARKIIEGEVVTSDDSDNGGDND